MPDAEELRQLLKAQRPDVVIVDIRLPPTHTDEGLQAAVEIRSAYPDVGVLVLSQYVELGLAMKLLADSAEGSGTCSRTASVTFPISSPPCAAWRLVARRGPDDRVDAAVAATE